MHESSYQKMKYFRKNYLSGLEGKKLRIMDFGSYDVNGSYLPIFDSPNWEYVGVDMAEGPGVDIVLKRVYFWDEISSNSFDVIISGQTFEHTEFFWLSILEMKRVLKNGGFCCILAPSAGYEHRYPVDCYRFYRDGMHAIAKFSGLITIETSTEWEPQKEYSDHSGEMWKDSLLIAQKEDSNRVYRQVKQFLFRMALKWLGDYRERIENK